MDGRRSAPEYDRTTGAQRCVNGHQRQADTCEQEANERWQPGFAGMQTEVWWKDQVTGPEEHREQCEPDHDQVSHFSIHFSKSPFNIRR